jgi:exodeoxyribonuclease V alpha subunit
VLELNATQQEAVHRCTDLTERLVAVTGPAGTGKTTIIRMAYDKLVKLGRKPILSAPTGRAAKRITEATGIPAMTLHRLLEFPRPGERDPQTGKALAPGMPKRNRLYPLDFTDILADEYSMVPNDLHAQITGAIAPGGRLCVFGDANQLPPIESTIKQSPFERILDKFGGITLTEIYRQDERSGILVNTERVLKGRVPMRLPDFTMKFTEKPVAELQDFVMECLDEGIDYSIVDNQIIVVGRKHWIGTRKLNAVLQSIFRPEDTGWIKLPRFEWDSAPDMPSVRVRPGDKVVWTENNYDLEIFNGEAGVVVETDPIIGEFSIDFGDRVVGIPREIGVESHGKVRIYDPRRQVDLAYAMTTHKMQGSECGAVTYVLNSAAGYNQCRENFYTAISRARRNVHLITDQKSVHSSLRPMRRGR